VSLYHIVNNPTRLKTHANAPSARNGVKRGRAGLTSGGNSREDYADQRQDIYGGLEVRGKRLDGKDAEVGKAFIVKLLIGLTALRT